MGFWLNIGLLTTLVLFVLLGSLRNWMKRQMKVRELQIQSAYGELDRDFPARVLKRNGEPDLGALRKILRDRSLAQVRPTLDMNWHGRKVPVTNLPFRVDNPDGRWQMVLTYDQTSKTLRASVYGRDLTQPVTYRDYSCCR